MNYIVEKVNGNFTNGKYYAKVLRGATVNIATLAERIQERCTVTRPDIKAVIDALVTAMNESLQAGEKVYLEGFGYFFLSILSKGAHSEEEFDINKNLKAIRCRFLPVATRDSATGAVTRTFTSGVKLRKVSLNSAASDSSDAGSNEGEE